MVIQAHHASDNQTLLTCMLMQVCCLRNIKCKTRLATLHSVFTHFVNYVRICIRMSSSLWLLPPHQGMLLDEMYKNYFEKIFEKPKLNESLNQHSLRSFLHKVNECNQISIKFIRIQQNYFGYSRTYASNKQNL